MHHTLCTNLCSVVQMTWSGEDPRQSEYFDYLRMQIIFPIAPLMYALGIGRYVVIFMHTVTQLKSSGIVVVFVFDGKNVPTKEMTRLQREK